LRLFFIAFVDTSLFAPEQRLSNRGILDSVAGFKVFEILALDRGSFLRLHGVVSFNDSRTNYFLTIFHVELLHSQKPDFLELLDLLEVGTVVGALSGIEASPESLGWVVRVADRVVVKVSVAFFVIEASLLLGLLGINFRLVKLLSRKGSNFPNLSILVL